MSPYVYLDYSATTPIHESVSAQMVRALTLDYGNPSSMHWGGKNARELIAHARGGIASSIGCSPDEIIFTSGATEADNLALFGIMRLYQPGSAHLITSSIEHHAVLHAAEQLEREGYAITCVGVDQSGLVKPEDVQRAIRPDTKLISIMHVNNEVGAVQPIAEIGNLARGLKILFHTDAVQGFGLFGINVEAMHIDLLSLSGHKIYGPKGIGALYLRRGLKLAPMIYGGPQEYNHRGGTENVPGICGLGAAVDFVQIHRAAEYIRIKALRRYLIENLREISPAMIINGPEEQVSPHIVSVSFIGHNAEMLLIRLNNAGIAVSLGSACNSESVEPSHVLTAMNLPTSQIESTLRVSLGFQTTQDELDFFLEMLKTELPRTRDQ